MYVNDFYSDFKPIRNILARLTLWEVLQKLYGIRRNSKPILVPEIIEFIYLNSIVYSPEYKNIKTKDNEKNWGKLLKQLTDFQDRVNALWIKQHGPWFYLHKAELNQFKAGTDNYLSHLYRYYYIFSKGTIAKHIESKIGMPYKDFFICAMWLHSVFSMKSYCSAKSYFLQKKWQGTTLSIENMTHTLAILSIPQEELKELLKLELKYDMNTFISHGYSHIKKPIFESGNMLYCLYHEQLLNQFTSGIYYLAEIYNEKRYGLGNVFGSAFEDYVGLILEKNKDSSRFTVRKEIIYTKSGNTLKTSDWIIETENAIVFIECKTKRLKIESKKIDEVQESDINGIADAVFQIYKVYSHYIQNIIPNLKFDSSKSLIAIILTLEEWFAGIPDFNEQVTEIVKNKLIEKDLDESLFDSYKFKIISISSFEIEVQLMTKLGFKEYFEILASGKLRKENYNYFNYFKDEIDRIFIAPLEKQFEDLGLNQP